MLGGGFQSGLGSVVGLDVAVQLHLQLCRSAATLRPGAHPTGATVQALLKQALSTCAFAWRAMEGQSQVGLHHPIHCLAACRQWWVGKAQLGFALVAF